jgi:simple sugar transport system permease protein
MTVLLGTGVLPWPSLAILPVIIIAAILAGAVVLLVPALMKTRFGVDEVVTTLLFNFIFLLFISMLLEGVLKDPMGMGWPKSARLIPEARLPRIVDGLRLHWGFGLAIFSAISEVAGLKGSLTLDLSPGFGYTGIIVAMLALLNPLGVVVAALFVAGIFVGADSMSRAADVPTYLADIMLATALLLMVLAIMLTRFRVVRN